MKNTSQSQMKNNWIWFLKIRPKSTREKPKMFLNLTNVPQDLGSWDPTFFHVWKYSSTSSKYSSTFSKYSSTAVQQVQ